MRKTFTKLFAIHLLVLFVYFFIFAGIQKLPSEEFPLFIFLAVLLAFALTKIIHHVYFKPIGRMREMTEKIARGQFPSRLPLARKDELGSLANNLSRMSAELQNKIAQLNRDKNELNAILSSMIEGVIVIGNNERIVFLTEPIRHMFDLRSKEAAGKPYWEVIRHEEINACFEEAIHSRKSLNKIITLLGPQESHFAMQISCVNSESRNLSGIVAVFHDITELKKLERLRSEFVANVSHELKTPLTTIKGFVETLKEGAVRDPANARKFLDIIEKHTARLENLVNDLLTLSSLESKAAELHLEKVRVSSFIHPIAVLFNDRLKNKELNLETDIPEDIPFVNVDHIKMEQVILNLLDNAIKFTPAAGAIKIETAVADDHVRIDVKDTGIGIEAAHLPRIFERFYRVDKGRSREMGGTGLGLSIVKHIVQQHGGRVAVQSTPGQGTVFSVFLPVKFP